MRGVGCRPMFQVLGVFLVLLVVGSVLFFTADPLDIPFWRLWLFSSFAPVSGAAMSFGALGMAWSLDGLVWVGASWWVARADGVVALRRRFGIVVVLALIVGALFASAR